MIATRPCPPPTARRRLHRRWAVLAVIGGVAAAPAAADVFEVDAGGSLIVRAGKAALSAGDGPETLPDEDQTAPPAALPDLPPSALTTPSAPAMPAALAPAVLDAARRWQVSPDLLSALVWQESGWRPAAVSAKGAIGLGQLMPATARALAVDPRDAAANLSGAAHYLRRLLDLFDGDVERALAAYNAGPERVLKAGGVPAIAETRAYVARIMDRLAATRGGTPTGVIQP